jgi:hypothetical protein
VKWHTVKPSCERPTISVAKLYHFYNLASRDTFQALQLHCIIGMLRMLRKQRCSRILRPGYALDVDYRMQLRKFVGAELFQRMNAVKKRR